LILVNIDAVPGLTHRILGRFATVSCVAFAGTGLRNEVVTGAPVRSEFQAIDRSTSAKRAAREQLGCNPEGPFIVAVTGSLGARSVNRAVLGLAATFSQRSGTIFHVTGRRDAAEIRTGSATIPDGSLEYRVVDFENRMALLYQAADVAITRAGALTVSELANVGVVGILVPLPGAPGDHQTKNARSLVDHGAGVLIPDIELSAERLSDELDRLLKSSERLDEMSAASRKLGHPNAADEVAVEVMTHARGT
jgi:UDP-N-acetylglucosamine--N-acetylmuramyl-(pentapeptide) pyrophosphoryl-undecaprenol N-acetylglucosamine transferase